MKKRQAHKRMKAIAILIGITGVVAAVVYYGRESYELVRMELCFNRGGEWDFEDGCKVPLDLTKI